MTTPTSSGFRRAANTVITLMVLIICLGMCAVVGRSISGPVPAAEYEPVTPIFLFAVDGCRVYEFTLGEGYPRRFLVTGVPNRMTGACVGAVAAP